MSEQRLKEVVFLLGVVAAGIFVGMVLQGLGITG